MVRKSIKRFAILSKLSELEKKFKKELAKSFLEYLETLSPRKRVQEMESILYETEVKRIVRLDQRLSRQESKCLYLAYKGKSVQETANILNIKPSTVEEYRAGLRKKLHVKTMEQAVGIGLKSFSSLTKVY